MSEMARALARNFKPRALWSLRLLVVCALLVPVFGLAQKALAATASDNFSRANGSLGPNWTNISDGGLAIVSQAAAGTASAGVSGDTWTAGTFTSDQYSQVAVTSTQLTGGQWIGPMVRAQNGGQNAYIGIYNWNFGSPVLQLFKRSGGSWTQLGSSYNSGPLAAGTQLQVQATGSTIAFLQNGVQRISATDASLSGGAPGIMSYGTGQAGNWSGGDVGGSGGTTYTVGGTVSGLTGTVVLQDNGGDNLSLSAAGPFTFATALATGAAYSVTVKTNPTGQTCTVASGSGTIASANITNVAVSCTTATTYTVGGTVSGLTGTVVLQDNGGDNLSLSAAGPFTFATALATGAAYSVTVKTNPTGQTCTVASGSGTIASANITNVAISCTTATTYTVGGTVSGLTGTVVLQDNGGDNLSLSAAGPFTFATALATGAAYSVTVKTNPTGQTCTVASGSGTIASANITNVAISCTTTAVIGSDNFSRANGSLGPNWTNISDGGLAIVSQAAAGTASAGVSGDTWTAGTFTSDQYSQVAVTSTQLTGGQWIGPMVRAQNGGQNAYIGIYNWNFGSPVLQLFKRSGGSWTQLGSSYNSGPLAAGTQLQVQATGSTIAFLQNGVQRISATDASLSGGAPGIMSYGTGQAGNWSGGDVGGSGGTTYTVGGTVSGLTGTVVLQDNGGDNLSLSAAGPFTFATALATGAAYSVTVKTNPTGQTCTVASGSGTIASANITNVAVSCTTATTYTVGGTVSGLTGTVVLQDNGGDNLSLSAAGPFTFATALATGAAYSVTVKTNPTGQTCTVASGSGTIASANITNVAVSCTTATTYTVGGTVSGLTGTVVLQDNGGDNLSLSAAGPFTFATALATGAAYSVTVKTNPTGQTCTVASGSGTIASANITNVAISCTTTAVIGSDNFSRANGSLGPNWTNISDGGLAIVSQAAAGTASAGVSGDTWTAGTFTSDQYSQVAVTSTQLTGGQWIGPMVRAQNGGQNAYIGIYNWNFGSPVLQLFKRSGGSWTQLGSSYNSGPLAAGTQLQVQATGSTIAFLQNGVQRISATDASLSGGAPGIMSYGTGQAGNWSGGDVGGSGGTTYTVGGTVSGLTGTVVLQDNGGDNLSLSAAGPFTFATALATGAAYSVTVKTNPTGQTCTVASGSGTIASANITNVAVSCTTATTYTVGGTVSGLTGTVVLQDNGGDNLSLSAAGPFTFATALATGAAYSVTVKTNPTGQTCTVASGSGTIASANITNVAVSCTTATTYTVGGTVSGLTGTVVLQDNGGDNLSLSAAGPFTFATALATGAAYSVTVKTNPTGQTCTVASGSGTIASANITNVAISCTTATGGFQVQYQSTDANGVESYQVTSANNGPGPQAMRVLRPTNPAPGVPHSFLYVLPVEAGLGNSFGDGLETLRALDAQDQYNLTIIEPTFGIDPWYADNPVNAAVQYDTFMTQELVPWAQKNLATTGSEQNWLIGFSKSGIGGQDLILRHPGVFTLAASWDFPADMSSYDQFGADSAEAYGTDANFQANYRLTTAFVDAHKGPFLGTNRMWIGNADGLYQGDMTDYDALLTSEGIAHSTEPPSAAMAHRWDSGWVPVALAALRQDSTNLP